MKTDELQSVADRMDKAAHAVLTAVGVLEAAVAALTATIRANHVEKVKRPKRTKRTVPHCAGGPVKMARLIVAPPPPPGTQLR